jgi:hypothetical protein
MLTVPNVVIAGGPPGGAALLLGLLMLIGISAALYVVCVFLAVRAAINFRRGRTINGVIYALIAAVPVVSYCYSWVVNMAAPASRAAEVSSWPRVKPDADKPFMRLELYGKYYDTRVMQLVEAGLIGVVAGDPDSSALHAYSSNYAYVAHHGADCIDQVVNGIVGDEVGFISAVLARHAFHDCPISQSKPKDEGGFVSPLPTLVLKDGPGSRYRGSACQAYGATIELRLPADAGGGLVDFYEPPLGLPLLPFIGPETGGWWICTHPLPLERAEAQMQQQKLFMMVAHAFGRSRPEDFARTASPEEAVAALGAISRMPDSWPARSAFLALLGQWPNTPAIAAALRPPAFRVVQYDIVEAYRILLDPKMEERRRTYYPNLHTHAAALFALCDGSYGSTPSCSERERDVSRKIEAHAFDPG